MSAETIMLDYPKGIAKEELLDLYKAILKPRLIEDKMMVLLRQGKISKWFSGYGQEAISVGCSMAMDTEEYILPMHRNLGVFTSRNVPLDKLFSQFQGKMNGFTKGRDRSFHFGTKEHNIVGMISHLGPQLGIADGIALGNLLKDNQKATMVFTGDGGASEGDFHEALNVAAVWQLPVIFVIENNAWGLSTPSNEQFRCKQFIDKGIGYGMKAEQVDGNNILEVYQKVTEIRELIKKNPQPVILECMTFRIRGHEESSGTKYYPDGLIEEWTKKDPVINFENYLLQENILNQEMIEEYKSAIKEEINAALNKVYDEPIIEADVETEIKDIFSPYTPKEVSPDFSEVKEIRFIDAISEAIDQSMQQHDNLVLMGQDIAEYGGVFKVTEGLIDKYSKARVRNTPLCESAIIGSGLGLSINGYKAMVEMQFADFVTCGFNQIVNNLAKIYYRWGQNADVVVRMPTGAGVNAGPFHSQSNEAWFFHTPGLKIVYPSNPVDAKGLLNAAFNDPNPVMVFEHKALYRSIKAEVPSSFYTLPIGKAAITKEGGALTVVTYGMGVHWAKQCVDTHNQDIEIVDLRTLSPLDTETIYQSVKKTGRAIVLHEDCLTGGIGGEIVSLIMENCFEYLDAPVKRMASLDTPVPFTIPLEEQFLPNADKLNTLVEELLNY